MAIGDDAAADGQTLVAGGAAANTLDTIINQVKDDIATRHNEVRSIARGGTGGSSAGAARTALGITPGNIGAAGDGIGTGLVFTSGGFGRLVWAAPGVSSGSELANTSATDALNSSKVNRSGDTMSGDLYLPGSSAATSGWTTAYIDGSGRVCRGASSLRYKKYVSTVTGSSFGNIFRPLSRFQMRGGDGRYTFGHLAEDLAANPDTERFVMYDGEGRPDSIDYIPLMLAKIEQLQERVAALEGGG
jgi:hypothetical protein